MKKLSILQNELILNLKIACRALMIVAVVFGFVFISYLDLTRPEVRPSEDGVTTTSINKVVPVQ